MKMLLLNPAQMPDNGRPLKVKKAFVIPFSVYMLAGQTPSDWDIEIANDYTDEIDYDGDYDLVGITLSTIHSRRGYQIAAEFKKRGRTVVMGGFHATLFTDEALQHADAVVSGEAEYVWPALLEDFKAGRLQRLYKADRYHDLRDLPPPRYDLINPKRYMVNVYPAETSRGCPFACNYCSVTEFYGQKYRVRPPADVVRDVLASGSRFITFVDDNVAAHLTRASAIFEALVPHKIYWMSQVTIRLADHEPTLALAARSGFRYAIVGLETLDRSNLEAVRKTRVNKVEEYVDRVKLFRKYGITVCANLMFGFDADEERTFDNTYHFLRRTKMVPNPYVITPYPGTPLYDDMERAGRLLHKDYAKYTAYRTVFKPTNFTPDALDAAFTRFYKKAYSIPNIVRRAVHMLRWREPVHSTLTQLALAASSLQVRRNVHAGILPYY
ncbi:B12-binding domain-containing radical SAM protein [bacterium]|nr:B12-binding domain-containing radical SAM protein [bacterium]